MNLPDSRARLADIVRVFGIEHDPSTESHSGGILDEAPQILDAPAGMVDQNSGGDFDCERIVEIDGLELGRDVLTVLEKIQVRI